jgi:hypothetical protein
MTSEKLQQIREHAYEMCVGNHNPDDVADYMAIASACARMESRNALAEELRFRAEHSTSEGNDGIPPLSRTPK